MSSPNDPSRVWSQLRVTKPEGDENQPGRKLLWQPTDWESIAIVLRFLATPEKVSEIKGLAMLQGCIPVAVTILYDGLEPHIEDLSDEDLRYDIKSLKIEMFTLTQLYPLTENKELFIELVNLIKWLQRCYSYLSRVTEALSRGEIVEIEAAVGFLIERHFQVTPHDRTDRPSIRRGCELAANLLYHYLSGVLYAHTCLLYTSPSPRD